MALAEGLISDNELVDQCLGDQDNYNICIKCLNNNKDFIKHLGTYISINDKS